MKSLYFLLVEAASIEYISYHIVTYMFLYWKKSNRPLKIPLKIKIAPNIQSEKKLIIGGVISLVASFVLGTDYRFLLVSHLLVQKLTDLPPDQDIVEYREDQNSSVQMLLFR